MLSEKNSFLEGQKKILEKERDLLTKTKTSLEGEVFNLHEKVSSLASSTDHKFDAVLSEKDRKVKDLERELDDLKQRNSQSLQKAEDMKSELETARQLVQDFETKKEKELERLRTHLLQANYNFIFFEHNAISGENKLEIRFVFSLYLKVKYLELFYEG